MKLPKIIQTTANQRSTVIQLNNGMQIEFYISTIPNRFCIHFSGIGDKCVSTSQTSSNQLSINVNPYRAST